MKKLVLIGLLVGAFPLVGASNQTLTSAAEILRAPDSSYQAHRRFELRGQVLSCTRSNFTIKDGSATLSIQADPQALEHLKPGDFVHATGELMVSDHGINDKRAISVVITGSAPIPEIQDASIAQINSGAFVHQRVRVTGVVASATLDEMDRNYLWLILRSSEGTVPVAVRATDGTLESITALIDAELVVSGILQRHSALTRPFTYFITTDEKSPAIVVKTPPGQDPFSAPLLADTRTLHRQRASGVVLATTATHFYLRTPWRRQLKVIPAPQVKIPEVGASVTAVGFAEGNHHDLQLVNSLIRPEATTELAIASPTPVTEQELYIDTASGHDLNPRYNGNLITLEGTLPYVPERNREFISLACGTHHVDLNLSGIDKHLSARLATGMRLRVSGLCLAQFDHENSSTLIPRFRNYTLLPRSAADIEILGNPPWWTPSRLLSALGVLLALLVGFAIWNRSLQQLSRRRGTQLFAEQIDRARSELKVTERTRLAVELHDSIAQTLTSVNFQIDTARRQSEGANPQLLRQLEIASKTLSSCRAELRNCLWDLRSEALESANMVTAIRQALKPNIRDCELHIRFAVPRELLSDKTTHAILCIIRELCLNAIHHGHATLIKIAGSIEADTLRFSVRDNGSGFDPSAVPGIREGHFGLQGIRERVSQLSGTLALDSQRGQGTRAEVSVHLSSAQIKN